MLLLENERLTVIPDRLTEEFALDFFTSSGNHLWAQSPIEIEGSNKHCINEQIICELILRQDNEARIDHGQVSERD